MIALILSSSTSTFFGCVAVFNFFHHINQSDAFSKKKDIEQLRTQLNQAQQNKTNKSVKLRKIPIKLLFNQPELNFRAEYTMFDRQTGRPVLLSDGETCQRIVNNTIEKFPCPPNFLIEQGNQYKPLGRLYVNIDACHTDTEINDELGAFIFRKTGFNSIRTLTARLAYYHAVSDGLLSNLPLQLTFRAKSSNQSYKQTMYFVDITLRDGISINEALVYAKAERDTQIASGFNQDALDTVARIGFNNSILEIGIEDSSDIIDEFYSTHQEHIQAEEPHSRLVTPDKQQLQQALKNSVQSV